MQKPRILSTVLLALFAMLFLVGCSGDQPATSKQDNGSASVAKQKAVSSDDNKISFKSEDGSRGLVVKRYADHDKLEIDYDGVTAVIKARANEQGRWKYKELNAEGDEKTFVAKVKHKSESFTLVDENEQLLWKVRIKDGKIKVSDNEENANACELKTKSSEKSGIRNAEGQEIGSVKFYPDTQKVKVKDQSGKELLVSKDTGTTSAPGVIMFSHIPMRHRAIIISELLRLGH